jgi:hypothetical protein
MKVGDYLYSIEYWSSFSKGTHHTICKRKIKKINEKTIILSDRIIKNPDINSYVCDEWFDNKKDMFISKLKAHLKEYECVLQEVKYLQKQVKRYNNDKNKLN